MFYKKTGRTTLSFVKSVVCTIFLFSIPHNIYAIEKNTNIIATVGPASEDVDTMKDLIKSGVNIFRLNFSHANHEYHAKLIANIRKASEKAGKKVEILADLQGPRFRIGKFKDKQVSIKTGDSFLFDLKDELGDSKRVQFPHPEIIAVMPVGNAIFVDEGKLRFEVVKNNKTSLTLKIIKGGQIKNNKGVNIPGVLLPVEVITTKDRKDVEFLLTQKPDYIALSFVQSEKELIELRGLFKGQKIKIVAKIETTPSIEEAQLKKIAKEADLIMVARGDLSVEVSVENIATAQNQIMKTLRSIEKPFIVATQMMESMTENIRPYNAEVIDVSYAVYNGAWSVMLSGETAMGKYPVETVSTMSAILANAERDMKNKTAIQINCGN